MEQTLLLNATFEPLDVVHWQRAMILWAQGKVEIVETHDKEVRSVSFTFKLPSVIRLLKLVRTRRRPQVQFTRANIYTRDNYTCQYCGKGFHSEDLTFDHVVPSSQGGIKSWENIVTCCFKCNGKKADKTPEQAGMHLLREPKKPVYNPIFRVTMGIKRTPESWRDYLYWNVSLENE